MKKKAPTAKSSQRFVLIGKPTGSSIKPLIRRIVPMGKTFCCLVLAAISTTSTAEEAYWFKQGYVVKGVTVGEEKLRTRPKICFNQQCLLIGEIDFPKNALMDKYGITHFTFEALSNIALETSIALESSGTDQLLLPDDLGQLIFQRAKRDQRLKRFNIECSKILPCR